MPVCKPPFNPSILWITDTHFLFSLDCYLWEVRIEPGVKEAGTFDFSCNTVICKESGGARHLLNSYSVTYAMGDRKFGFITCCKDGDTFTYEIFEFKFDCGIGSMSIKAEMVLPGIARFSGYNEGMLVLIMEGKLPHEHVEEPNQTTPPKPSSEEATNPLLPVPATEVEPKNYTWTQTMEDVEVSIKLPSGILKSDLVVDIGLDTLDVRTRGGQVLFKERLFGKLEPGESSWAISSDKRHVEVMLNKYQSAHNWAHLLHTPNYDPAGNLLGEISELSETELRQMMARMQGLNQYTSDTLDKAPLFTPNSELEECDELDGNQVLISTYDMGLVVPKQQHLIEMSPGCLLFADRDQGFVVSHSVDAAYYKLGNLKNPFQHSATFHALNMVQATKTQKKFVVCAPDQSYVAISDLTRHLYIYQCEKDGNFGKLLVMTLDNDDSEIMGISAQVNDILVLTEKNFIEISFDF